MSGMTKVLVANFQPWRKPYTVVLFDRKSKSSPDVFNMLLQIFMKVTLTDAKGSRIKNLRC